MNFDFNETLETAKTLARETAQVAARKAKDLTSIGKYKLDIMAEQDKVRKAQLELGRLCYRDYAVSEEPDQAEYLPWCQKIDASKQLIAELEDKIAAIRAEDTVPSEPAEAPVVIDLPVRDEE